MSWAVPQDVIDRWIGSGEPTDMDLVQALLNDSESVILASYPLIQDRIDAGTLPLQTVIMVQVRMVTRLLRNPEGLSYWQQTTGPFGQARNYGDRTDIWLTADEKAMLAPNRTGKAYSVNIGPYATSPVDTIWVAVGESGL